MLLVTASGLYGMEEKLDPGPRSDWNGHLPPPEGQVLDTITTLYLVYLVTKGNQIVEYSNLHISRGTSSSRVKKRI
jgi:hypothetical protein